jgi:hypothetical protein
MELRLQELQTSIFGIGSGTQVFSKKKGEGQRRKGSGTQ